MTALMKSKREETKLRLQKLHNSDVITDLELLFLGTKNKIINWKLFIFLDYLLIFVMPFKTTVVYISFSIAIAKCTQCIRKLTAGL